MAKLSVIKITITEFLEAYRRQPCLYNTRLDTYKNRVKRYEAYCAIIKSLKVPQLTVNDIKRKIKIVRRVYCKLLRLWMREKKLGRDYEPKRSWFKLADSFLRSAALPHLKRIRKENVRPQAHATDLCMREDALQEEGEQELDPEEMEETESICLGEAASVATAEADAVSSQAKQLIDDSSKCVMEPQQSQLPSFTQFLQSLNSQQPTAQLTPIPIDTSASFSGDDDLMFFGQNIASQLRTITDPHSRSIAKLYIQEVLFQAETGHLRNNGENVNPHLHTFN